MRRRTGARASGGNGWRRWPTSTRSTGAPSGSASSASRRRARDAIDRQLAYWDRYLALVRDEGPPQPTLDATLAWLRANAFTPRRVALCWGDSRLPNMMFRDDRVAAVLDWEMAFLGDPEADLGWWCFLDWANNEGYGGPHLDGIPGKAETLARYAELTGHPVEHAHWHEVFAAFRYGVILGRVAIRMRAIGASLPADDWESNNVCTQALARLLDLPPPGEERLTTSVGRREAERAGPAAVPALAATAEATGTSLVHGDEASRHAGVVDDRMRRSRPTSPTGVASRRRPRPAAAPSWTASCGSAATSPCSCCTRRYITRLSQET